MVGPTGLNSSCNLCCSSAVLLSPVSMPEEVLARLLCQPVPHSARPHLQMVLEVSVVRPEAVQGLEVFLSTPTYRWIHQLGTGHFTLDTTVFSSLITIVYSSLITTVYSTLITTVYSTLYTTVFSQDFSRFLGLHHRSVFSVQCFV